MQSYLKVHCFWFRKWCIGTWMCGSGTKDICYNTEIYLLLRPHWCPPRCHTCVCSCVCDLYCTAEARVCSLCDRGSRVALPEGGWQHWELVAAWAGHRMCLHQRWAQDRNPQGGVWPPCCLSTATDDFTSLTLWNCVLFTAIETIQIIPSTYRTRTWYTGLEKRSCTVSVKQPAKQESKCLSYLPQSLTKCRTFWHP